MACEPVARVRAGCKMAGHHGSVVRLGLTLDVGLGRPEKLEALRSVRSDVLRLSSRFWLSSH